MLSLRNTLCCRRLSLQTTRRRFVSKLKEEKSHETRPLKKMISSEPPFPIQVALVSSSTALCTPIFPAIGFVNICLRAMVPNKKLRSQLSASMGSILSFACWTLVPFSYNIAPLMLPFAISNGVSAGVGYAILFQAQKLIQVEGSGGPKNSKILNNPLLTGGGIGAFTGFVAPNFLYGETYNLIYGIDSLTPVMKQLMATPFISQISTSTGFIAGCAMYPLLHYPMFGIKNVPWTSFSGILLLLSAASVYNVYKIDNENHEMIAPVGSFVNPELVPSLNAIVRYNTQTKQFESFSLTTNEWIGSPEVSEKGNSVADSVKAYQKQTDSWGQTFTFDNPMLSYLCHYIDRGVAERFPESIVSLKDEQTMKYFREIMYITDLVVALLNEKNNTLSHEDMIEEKVAQMVHIQKDRRASQCRRLLKSIASVSTGVELAIVMKQQGINEMYSNQLKAVVTLDDMESWVRRKAPDMLLFQTDEEDHSLKGESVESQLLKLAHQPEKIDYLLDKWVETSSNERRTTRWKFGIAATTIGAFATILSQMYLT